MACILKSPIFWALWAAGTAGAVVGRHTSDGMPWWLSTAAAVAYTGAAAALERWYVGPRRRHVERVTTLRCAACSSVAGRTVRYEEIGNSVLPIYDHHRDGL